MWRAQGPAAGGSSSAASASASTPASASASSGPAATSYAERKRQSKEALFDKLLTAADVDLGKLREASWTGVPAARRRVVWQLMLGYVPTQKSRREATLRRKREEYLNSLPKYYGNENAELLEEDQKNLRQILVDIPRTAPDLPLFHSEEVRRSLERILYIWAIRHPASGYVQGMNDLVTPFYTVFLADEMTGGDVNATNTCDVSSVPKDVLDSIEADCYWCLTKLLDGIQDHYTCSQPGIQRMVWRLQGIVQRIDTPLFEHFQEQGINFLQFAFRWMNCLLLRELPLDTVVRLWDTLLAEDSNGFDTFHVYVCSALLAMFSDEVSAHCACSLCPLLAISRANAAFLTAQERIPIPPPAPLTHSSSASMWKTLSCFCNNCPRKSGTTTTLRHCSARRLYSSRSLTGARRI